MNRTCDQMEGLGESLVLLSDDFETDHDRISAIFRNTHRTDRGIPCLWPRFDVKESPDHIASYYHNGRIWPFVQGYWATAAARHGQLDVFEYELKSLIALSQVDTTFAEFYDLDGSFPSSRRRQMWSASGFLSMVFHGLFGMIFLPHGIEIRPIKPKGSYFASTISLKNVSYRNMKLDIYVSGVGRNIRLFELDGVIVEKPFVHASFTGRHVVKVILEEKDTPLTPHI